MTLIHNLYIGHFIPKENFVRFDDGQLVCERPLDMAFVADLAKKHFGESSLDHISSIHGMIITKEYIVANRYGDSRALDFIADYAKRKNALVVDMASFTMVNPDGLTSIQCK